VRRLDGRHGQCRRRGQNLVGRHRESLDKALEMPPLRSLLLAGAIGTGARCVAAMWSRTPPPSDTALLHAQLEPQPLNEPLRAHKLVELRQRRLGRAFCVLARLRLSTALASTPLASFRRLEIHDDAARFGHNIRREGARLLGRQRATLAPVCQSCLMHGGDSRPGRIEVHLGA
jgi:hypothetical protein